MSVVLIACISVHGSYAQHKWDNQFVIQSSNPNQKCRWSNYRTLRGNQGLICLHNKGDQYVSGSVVQHGRWGGCDLLPTQYDKYAGEIYVDIGANIGTCVLTMLLDTNAKIIAFEPNPDNLFCLTSTLMNMNPEHRKRVTLFALALGSKRGRNTINAPQQNMGNGVVGRVVKDFDTQVFNPPIPIWVDVLDRIWRPSKNTRIPIVKVDVQGYECEVFRGAMRFLKHVESVLSEIELRFLDGTTEACSAVILKELLLSKGLVHKSGELFERV